MATGVGVRAASHEAGDQGDELDVVADARPAPPQGIGGVTLSELWNGVVRYKPVAAAIAVILVAAVVLPGAALLDDDGFDSAATTTRPSVVSASEISGFDTASAADASPATASLDAAAALGPTLVDAAVRSDLAAASGSSTNLADTAASTATSAPTVATTPAATQPAAAPAMVATTAPSYGVREAGWATAGSASPLAGADVPEGGLPVGKRLGDVDKLSLVRLSGTSNALVLNVAEAPGANRFTDQAKVQACRVLDGSWEARPAMRLDEAPPYDRNACALAEVQADGTWRFDLSGFTDAADSRGFALVPAPDAGTDFRVVFQPA